MNIQWTFHHLFTVQEVAAPRRCSKTRPHNATILRETQVPDRWSPLNQYHERIWVGAPRQAATAAALTPLSAGGVELRVLSNDPILTLQVCDT